MPEDRFENCPTFSKFFRIFPKTSDNFRRFRKHFKNAGRLFEALCDKFRNFPKISEGIRRLPKTSDDFRRFHKKLKNLSILQDFPIFSEDFRKFPKTSEDFQRFSKILETCRNVCICTLPYVFLSFPKNFLTFNKGYTNPYFRQLIDH